MDDLLDNFASLFPSHRPRRATNTANSLEPTVLTCLTFSYYSVPSQSIDNLGAGSSSKTREMLSQIDTATVTAMQDIDRAVRARSRSESERAESWPKDI